MIDDSSSPSLRGCKSCRIPNSVFDCVVLKSISALCQCTVYHLNIIVSQISASFLLRLNGNPQRAPCSHIHLHVILSATLNANVSISKFGVLRNQHRIFRIRDAKGTLTRSPLKIKLLASLFANRNEFLII